MRIHSFNEFLNESTGGQVLLVRVDKPTGGDEQFLYAFLVPGSSKFKKSGRELTMMHLDRSWPCWRIVMDSDSGKLKCSKAQWPKMLDGRHLVLNDNKTPMHWQSLAYDNPGKFVKEFESAIIKEKNIDYK